LKKLLLSALLVVMAMISLGATKLPYPVQGEYTGKIVNLPGEDFFKPDYLIQRANDAVLMDTKPEELRVDPEIKLNNPKYGSILLGDNEKQTYFVMAQNNDGYWMDFYLDQNQDYQITPAEKLKTLEKWDLQKVNKNWVLMESSLTNNPLPILVSYKGSVGEMKKKLSFYLWIKCLTHQGNDGQTFVTFATASVFEGFIKVLLGKDEKLAKFRITDGNCNGCFNDYGKDFIYLDLNFDGYFSKKEAMPLYEFFDIKTGKVTTQMRLLIPNYPAGIAVIPATQNYDTTHLEATLDTF
jgi:hypothetical protein